MNLSIIIPAYNVEKYIGSTLQSLIDQSEKQFEVIVVDDGSTDNTFNLVQELLSKEQLKKCKIIKKENGGVSSARNIGLENACGTYVMFLDGDDYVAYDLVENIYKHNGKDVICWGFDEVGENKATIKQYFNQYDNKIYDMTGVQALKNIIIKNTMWIWTGSVVYRRELLLNNNLRYTEGCINGEDQEFNFKALSCAKDVLFIDKVLSYYVQRSGSISNVYNIRKFDFIAPIKRTIQYMNNINEPNLKEIINTLGNKILIDNYFHNLKACLRYNKKEKNDINIKTLLRDIDEAYPEINKEIFYIMKNYKGDNIKSLIKIKLFLISPRLFSWCINFK